MPRNRGCSHLNRHSADSSHALSAWNSDSACCWYSCSVARYGKEWRWLNLRFHIKGVGSRLSATVLLNPRKVSSTAKKRLPTHQRNQVRAIFPAGSHVEDW